MNNTMENIKSISHFDSAYDLLVECLTYEAFDDLDEDIKLYFENFDDFEGYDYFLVDGHAVFCTDGPSGDVNGFFDDVQALYDCILVCYHEDND